MKYINLTSHMIRVRHEEDTRAEPLETDLVLQTLGKDEMPALRVAENVVNETIVEGIRIRSVRLGEIEGLPEQREGVILVTSMPTAERAYALGRRDVVAPDTGPDRITFKLPNGQEGVYAVRGFRYIVG